LGEKKDIPHGPPDTVLILKKGNWCDGLGLGKKKESGNQKRADPKPICKWVFWLKS
jgi:hypothetical protein